MAIIRCKRGHYYDNDKYARCPQCGMLVELNRSDLKPGGDDSVTLRLGSSSTRNTDVSDDEITVRYIDTGNGREENGRGLVTGWLVCISGPARGRDYRIFYGRNSVGRNTGMDICVEEDTTISREKHCSIIYEDRQNRFYLMPEKGIAYLNDKMLEKSAELFEGDVIGIGACEFAFVPFLKGDRTWKKL